LRERREFQANGIQRSLPGNASSLRERLSARKLNHAGNSFGVVTDSVGCATVTPQLGQGSSTLIEWADQALYRAKSRGRNQVCVADEELASAERQNAVSIRAAKVSKVS
jgi:GGDEF domain-containing protein